GVGHRPPRQPVVVGPGGIGALVLRVQARETESTSEALEVDERRRALAERHRVFAGDRHERAEAPEAAGPVLVRELARRQTRETGQIELDGEVDGDAGFTATRAAGEVEAGRVAVATPEALEAQHAGCRGHGE